MIVIDNKIKLPAGTKGSVLAYFDDMPLATRKADAAAILGRMKEAFGVKKNTELAKILGYNVKQPGKWVAAGSVPIKIIRYCHDHTDATMDYLYCGIEAQPALDKEQTRELLAVAIGTAIKKGVKLEAISFSGPGDPEEDHALLTHIFTREIMALLFPNKPDEAIAAD